MTAIRYPSRLPKLRSRKAKSSRSVLVRSVLVLLILLLGAWLFMSMRGGDKQPALIVRHAVTTLPTLNEHSPVFSRQDSRSGESIRVLIAVVATKLNMVSCMSIGSGFLSGIPVTIVGYNSSLKYNHVHKVRWTLDAARKAGLRSNDVVYFLDSDTLFTGREQLLRVIDAFISESAPSPEELDARAVREGRVRAPMLISREANCYAPQTFGSYEKCIEYFRTNSSAYNAYAQAHGIAQYVKTFSHINSGTYLARMWALTEAYEGITRFMTQHRRPIVGGKVWWSDQSIFNALYLNLRRWEMQQDVLLDASPAALEMKSPYGLRGGLLEVDERNELVVVYAPDAFHLSNELWLEDSTRAQLFPVGDQNYAGYIDGIYNYYPGPLLRVPLPTTSSTHHSVDGGRYFLKTAPPTVIVDHMGNVLASHVPRRVATPLLHFPGKHLDYLDRALSSVTFTGPNAAGGKETLNGASEKIPKMTCNIPYMSWYIPLQRDPTELAAAKAFLSQLQLPVLSPDHVEEIGHVSNSSSNGSKHSINDDKINNNGERGALSFLSYKEVCMDAFTATDAVDPLLYRYTSDAYNLFFNYTQQRAAVDLLAIFRWL